MGEGKAGDAQVHEGHDPTPVSRQTGTAWKLARSTPRSLRLGAPLPRWHPLSVVPPIVEKGARRGPIRQLCIKRRLRAMDISMPRPRPSVVMAVPP